MTKVTPVETLNSVIAETASHIQDFTKSPTDFTRNRKLNAETMLKVTLNMEGNSINAELLNAFPNLDERMTESAYEQAKAKLTPKVFEYIFHQYNEKMVANKLLDDTYRVLAIDGSDFRTPFNKNSKRIMTAKDGSLCCLTHANLLYDIENKIYQDCFLQGKPVSNERDSAITMLQRFHSDDPYIVIMDRGYESFNMIETCNRLPNCYYVIRARAGKCGGIWEINSLPDKECDIDLDLIITTSQVYWTTWKNSQPNLHWVKHPKKQYKATLSDKTKKPVRWDFEDVCHVKFRVVKFKIADTNGNEIWEALITNLDRFEFPVDRMKELYHKRWDIETSFRTLKYALGAINFHSKKDEFIDMEILAHLTMFNAVAYCINETKLPTRNAKTTYAVDHKMACHIVRKYFYRTNNQPYRNIHLEISAYVMPIRPGRSDIRKLNVKPPIWFVYRVA